MNPKDLKLYTFIDSGLLMDVYVSLEQRNVYMKQTEIAKLLEIDKATVSRLINYMKESQMGQVAELVQICNKNGKSFAEYYGLKIIKEIGEKYNPERIKKLEEWLENLIIENTKEVVDDNYIIVRYNQDNLDIPTKYHIPTNTIWLTQNDIANLFNTTRSDIIHHIQTLFEDKEIEKNSICQQYLHMGKNGRTYRTTLYGIDVILIIGYRVRTLEAVHFRLWANEMIKKMLNINYRYPFRDFKYIEEHNAKRIDDHDERLTKLEKEVESLDPKYIIYSRNESYDAYLLLSTFIATASKEVFLIDIYADRFTLSLLMNVRSGVNIIIVTNNINRISKEEIEIFERSHQNTAIVFVETNDEHDRFLFVDRKCGYNLGQSINTLGYNKVNFEKITDKEFIENKIKEYYSESCKII